jgi:putative protease
MKESYFIPASLMANWRRDALALLDEKWNAKWNCQYEEIASTVFNRKEHKEFTQRAQKRNTTYLQNIHNAKAEAIYCELGFENITYSFEKHPPQEEVAVMFCKYCIKKTLGDCSKNSAQKLPEPLFLESGNIRFRLVFDCSECEMRVYF